jgi:pimeloyl-ACP methyl ester carboxylesterase
MDTWTPLISALKLDKSHDLHLYDFEGHGLSPTSPLSRLSIESLAQDVHNLLEHAQISQPAIIFGHSMGCLIAGQLALSHPKTVRQLILLGPPTQPLPETASKATYQRAETVRKDGMDAVLDAVVSAGTSEATKTSNGSAVAAVRLSLAAQDPESYAKACSALAGTNSRPVDFSRIAAETVVVTGADDKVSPPTWCKQLSENKNVAKSTVLPDVGHWHTFESVNGVADAVAGFLRKDQA